MDHGYLTMVRGQRWERCRLRSRKVRVAREVNAFLATHADTTAAAAEARP